MYVAVFLLALGARVSVLVAFETYRFDPADDYWRAGYETGQIAWHLAEGRGFLLDLSILEPRPPAPSAWLSPLYPYLVAVPFSLFGSFSETSLLLVLLFQSLIGALSAAGLCFLGRHAGVPPAGLLAGLVLAVWPTAVARDVRVIWGTTLFIFLAVVLTILFLRLARDDDLWIALLTGLVAGLLLLTEPTGATFALALLVWLGLRVGTAAIPRIAVVTAMVTLLLLPWTVRNYVQFDRLIPLKSNFGHELFIGNHPGSDGRYHRVSDLVQYVPPEIRDALSGASEVELSRILGREAVRHIRDNPFDFFLVTLRRVVLFWRLPSYGEWNRMGIGGVVGHISGWLYEAGHVAILLLAAVGAVFAVRSQRGLVPVLLFLVAYPVPYYITHVDIGRYRSPVFAFLSLLAAYAVVRAWRVLVIGPPTGHGAGGAGNRAAWPA